MLRCVIPVEFQVSGEIVGCGLTCLGSLVQSEGRGGSLGDFKALKR